MAPPQTAAPPPPAPARTAHTARRLRHGLTWEWLAMSVLLLAGVLWLSGPGYLSHSQAWLQELGRWWHRVPPSPQVVLVTVDERSLAAVGRWPWRRALHAQLIRHIDAGAPQSIGLDIAFTEDDWDYPEDDLLLAQAIAASGRVVLPVLRSTDASGGDGVLPPLPALLQAAARVGHVQLPVDADGGVRSFYAQEGPAAQPWLHLGLSMVCVAQPAGPGCAATAAKPPTAATATGWQRHGLAQIAVASGQPPFTTYSYLDVLSGRIPASAFRHKHVLVGAVATGLGTPLAVPGAAAKTTANVELTAHILSGALQHQHATSASAAANRAFNAVPVALALATLAVLGPSAALAVCLGLAVTTLLLAGAAPVWWQLAFNPSAAVLALLLAYPLWSWRRLNAAAHFLNQEMQGLQRQGLAVAPAGGGRAGWREGDFLQHRITAVEQASQQLRQLHHFVTQTLLQLPSPTLACDAHDRIVLANSAAHRYAESLGRTLREGQPVADLLDGAMERGTLAPLWNPQQPPPQATPLQREGMDVRQRSLLLISQPFVVGSDHGRLLSLVDISELREALAQRDQAMHFISHDIRAPIGAILTVIEMEQHFGAHSPTPTQAPAGSPDAPSASSPESSAPGLMVERIQRYARSALALADDFVHLARAQHQGPNHIQHQPVELGALLDQALDDTWAAAQQRFVQLEWMPSEAEAWVHGDAGMLRRACVNLLTNAIKYGPVEGTVHCTLEEDATHWRLGIRDEGEGISQAEQARLFAPFTRQQQHEAGRIAGTGLGLAYVHTTAMLHGGRVQVVSTPGHGAQFVLSLPKAGGPTAVD